MDKKTIAKYRARIRKANQSFGAMGTMILVIEFQGMTQDTRIVLRDALLNSRKPIQSVELNEIIEKNS